MTFLYKLRGGREILSPLIYKEYQTKDNNGNNDTINMLVGTRYDNNDRL
jgi:hypothetical protein